MGEGAGLVRLSHLTESLFVKKCSVGTLCLLFVSDCETLLTFVVGDADLFLLTCTSCTLIT